MPNPKPKTPQRRHLSSNVPIVFFAQILIVVTVIFMVTYLIFAYAWGKQRHIVRVENPIQVQAPSGTIDQTAIKNGIDESQFQDQLDGSFDRSKLQGLFPELKK